MPRAKPSERRSRRTKAQQAEIGDVPLNIEASRVGIKTSLALRSSRRHEEGKRKMRRAMSQLVKGSQMGEVRAMENKEKELKKIPTPYKASKSRRYT